MLRRRWFIGCLALVLSLSFLGSALPAQNATAAAKPVQVTIDGKPVSFETAPLVKQGRTLVPYRDIVEAMGGTVDWNNQTKTVTAKKGGIQVTYTVGSKTARVNGESVTLDTAPVTNNDRTFIPLRSLAESFGMWVSWDKAQNKAAITTTRTVQTKTGPLTLKKRPSRIVTLSSSDTEIMLALGGNVVGRSTVLGQVRPPEAAAIPEVGNAHEIRFEKLATLKPDLVVGSPSLMQHKGTVEKLGATMLFNSHNTYADIQHTIRLYGQVLGREEAAEKLIRDLDAQMKRATQTMPAHKPKAIILYGAPGSFVVALPSSYPGNILELAGGVNAAASFPKLDTMPQYAELSLERIVAANPDAIYLITHGDPEAVLESFKKELESNPVWKNLNAVKNGHYEVLPNDLFAANPGLRIPDAVKHLNELLRQVKA